MEKQEKGIVWVRFRREQDYLSIRRRCERLRIHLLRAVCMNGAQHLWALHVASAPSEAIRRHAALDGAVVFARLATDYQPLRRRFRCGRRAV